MAAGLSCAEHPCSLAGLTAGLLLALAAGFALPALADSRGPTASPDMRQLATPYEAPPRSRLIRAARARHARPIAAPRRAPSAARSILSSQLTRSGHGRWRGYRPLAMRQVRSGSPVRFRERWTGEASRDVSARGPRRRSLMRKPPVSREIVVDQLLIIPREGGYGDDRLPSLANAGIPVFRDVPAIVIVNPPRPERDRFGTPLRHPAR